MQRCAAQSTHADHHRRLRHRRRHPGAAQLQGRARIHLQSSTPRPTSSTRWPRPRRSPSMSTSTSSCTAARSTSISCSKCSARSCMAASRTSRRTASASSASCAAPSACWWRRHPVPRPGHACRLRRDLPGVQPRLLRLLRSDGDAEHRVAERAAGRTAAWANATLQRVYSTFNVDGWPFRKESEAPEHEHSKTINVDYLARVEGEGGCTINFERRQGQRCGTAASSSRRASSRRSCAAAPTPKRPTSPRGSAASAPSPTR